MLRSGLFLVGGNMVTALVLLVRNVLVARLLSVEDFGVASTFAITLSLMEMLSNVGIDRLLVQAKDGEDPRLQSSLQTLQFVRGLISAALMIAVAGPYAALMGVPDVAWAYQVMALTAAFRGLVHLDVFRAQRNMLFGPWIAATLGAAVVATLVVWPLAVALGDYSVMLWSLVLQQAVYAAISHAMAKRGYRLGWDPAVFRRALAFGLPLLGNGALLFVIMHGDRIVIANALDIETLGWFSVAFTLTLMPTYVLSSSMQTFFLPQLSKLQDDAEGFRRFSIVVFEASVATGAFMVAVFSLAGPLALLILFGAKYEAALTILIPLAVAQGVRVARGSAAIMALALKRTNVLLIANVCRAITVPVAYLALINGARLVDIVWLAALGECASFALALVLLKAPIRQLLAPAAGGAFIVALFALDDYLWPPGPDMLGNYHMAQLGLLAAIALSPLMFPRLRRWLLSFRSSA